MNEEMQLMLSDDETAQLLEFTDDEEEVGLTILRERNEEIREIARDTSLIAEIMTMLSTMVSEQGEQLDVAEAHLEQAAEDTEDAANTLARAATWQERARGTMVDITTFAVGTGLGAMGFLGGPWVGLPTLVGGVATASSIVAIRRKIKQ